MPINTPKRRVHYPPAFIARARALYLIKGKGPNEIADQLDVPPDTLKNWISRGRWAEERKTRLARLETVALSRAENENSAFLDSMGTQSEELAEDGMQLAREAVVSKEDNAARNFQSATQGVKNAVDVYFRARGIDGRNAGQTINVNSVFIHAQPVPLERIQSVDLTEVQPPKVIE